MPEVVGRETELAVVRGFIDVVPEGPTALVLEGEPGIGKTTLWSAGVELAKDRSLRVLSSRSAESEAKLSYGGLLDLLGEAPSDATESLPEVQRRALDVALLRADPEGVALDPRTVCAATLGVIRWYAANGPTVLALDDPQWMDAASADVLAYTLRRLQEEPVGLLAAIRTEPGSATSDPFDLARSLPGRVRGFALEPLSEEALERLVRRRLGDAITGSVLLELHRASGGNPLFALEIARATVRGTEGQTPAIVLPSTLKAQVGSRLATMSAEARRLLLTAASLSRPTVAMALRAANVDDGALTEATTADLLEVDGDWLRFTHPVYASVAYAGAPLEDRSRIHRRLADLVSDPEERARHLALAGAHPDADIADALEEAARITRSRGARVTAAELWLEAVRFTAEGAADDARRRTLQAADELNEVGDIRRAVTLLEGLLPTCPAGQARAEVLYQLGCVATWGTSGRLNQAESLLEQAEIEAGGDLLLVCAIRRERVWPACQRYQYATAARHARPALELAELSGDQAAMASCMALMSWAEMVRGRGVVDETFERAVTLWNTLRASGLRIALDDHPCLLLGEVLLCADRLDEARRLLEDWRRETLEVGSDSARSIALGDLCHLERLAGDWDRASRWADEACGLSINQGVAALSRGAVAACQGRVDEARGDLLRGLEFVESHGAVEVVVCGLTELGFLELSLGNLPEAHRHLSRMTQLFFDAGILEPGMGRFLPDAIETLVGLGDLAEAERLTDWLEERGQALDRVSALATGARCRGLLLSAKGDHEGALEHLDRAMVEHDRLPMPFERARTLLVLGSVRRRADHKRAAREALSEALGIFERLGAALWAEKARVELSSIGGRAPGIGELTPMEDRVAHLAAAGRTNREIAGTLFLSVRTVESHLSHAYHKLGVRSRTELALHLDPTEAST